MFSAFEANAQSNLNVSATVPDICQIDSAANIPLAFDLSGLAGASADFAATANFSWRCSFGTVVTISLTAGANSASALTRRMSGPGGAFLDYSITSGAADVGDGSNGANAITDAGLGFAAVNQVTTVFDGLVTLAAAQAAPPGLYQDTVVISILP